MLNDMERLYSDLIKKFGDSPQGVNWKDQNAQRIRFEQLAKVLPPDSSFSVNDLGCGFGDFAAFLQESKFQFKYFGYDLVSEMVKMASVKFANTPDVSFHCIVNTDQMQTSNFTVASGIFNILFGSQEEWLKHILETLSVMNKKSSDGFAFNLLTSYSDAEFMRSDLYYASPLFFFDYCKIHFSRNVALLHDYNQYDFTIIVRKN
jgi:SAM-dependent methyltransferase